MPLLQHSSLPLLSADVIELLSAAPRRRWAGCSLSLTSPGTRSCILHPACRPFFPPSITIACRQYVVCASLNHQKASLEKGAQTTFSPWSGGSTSVIDWQYGCCGDRSKEPPFRCSVAHQLPRCRDRQDLYVVIDWLTSLEQRTNRSSSLCFQHPSLSAPSECRHRLPRSCPLDRHGLRIHTASRQHPQTSLRSLLVLSTDAQTGPYRRYAIATHLPHWMSCRTVRVWVARPPMRPHISRTAPRAWRYRPWARRG